MIIILFKQNTIFRAKIIMMNIYGLNASKQSGRRIIMLGFNFYDAFEVWLIEVFACVSQDVFWLLLQHLEQKHRYHVLKLWVLSEVSFIIHSILNFFAI